MRVFFNLFRWQDHVTRFFIKSSWFRQRWLLSRRHSLVLEQLTIAGRECCIVVQSGNGIRGRWPLCECVSKVRLELTRFKLSHTQTCAPIVASNNCDALSARLFPAAWWVSTRLLAGGVFLLLRSPLALGLRRLVGARGRDCAELIYSNGPFPQPSVKGITPSPGCCRPLISFLSGLGCAATANFANEFGDFGRALLDA